MWCNFAERRGHILAAHDEEGDSFLGTISLLIQAPVL
jgi:hypothetical protein